MNRRAFLRNTLVGCSVAASPLITPISFAGAPTDNRLVVILLRGGMDGLGVVRPHGDPDYIATRGAPDRRALDLDGFFALHPALADLMPLWSAGELSFAHAVSTPYRDKRSHFDGQDLLEAGSVALNQVRDGWMNRMLAHLPGAHLDTAYAIGNDPLPVLSGAVPVKRWSPQADLALSPQAIRLAHLVMEDDPAMAAALTEAFELADSDGDAVAFEGTPREMMSMMAADTRRPRGQTAEVGLAKFAANRLSGASRVASFSINGWDTHARQERNLARALQSLSRVIVTLRDELSPHIWQRTTVVAVTEFGRTARLNGSQGTDHGTGGAMLMAGGALNGGRVITDWPGLAEADLYDRRDLMPTRDVRAHLGWLMRGMFALDRSAIERDIFPGLELGDDPGLLL